ncbi:hypothetical protein J2849_000959 [Azospirillum melinis]|nr:hypothetical protein [Azospirillum melinis]
MKRWRSLEVISPAFEGLYSKIGRPSIPPEKLLRALLLQAFYSVRSERQLMEQLDYNLLFRWFVGLSMDAPVWDVTVFTKNRERLLAGDVATKFLATGLAEREAAVSMVEAIPGRHRITVGADKAYDTKDFVANMRELDAAAHVAQNTSNRRSAIDGRTTRHPGYAISLRIRKRIEEVFGWMFTLTAAAYSLIRLPKLLAAA